MKYNQYSPYLKKIIFVPQMLVNVKYFYSVQNDVVTHLSMWCCTTPTIAFQRNEL